ncbi:dihydroorotate dehydrogenase [Brevibacillus ruminantium]|uniref:Dihydroorotate dehydrogenase n=1 Tax=Brevibacillus ruminantium TaxID=2950604 RepID=A0ABY4WQ23_9BACL|nr:dihydroorotate dehydrogenase [Brevibacillus ruminantium]USG67504.1 dihydroorotate dehydrogenase [Brevibacillus ruminantium]
MPDWSYQTLFRPFLFSLPARVARQLTLNAIGTLAKCPGGPSIIELMGHMKPPAELGREHWGITFSTPVGLGAGLDPDARALSALSQFGFGYVELGPVTRDAIAEAEPILRHVQEASLFYPVPRANTGVKQLIERLKKSKRVDVPLGARLSFQPGSSPQEAALERREMMEMLSPYCQFFTLDTSQQCLHDGWDQAGWREHLALLSHETTVPMLLVLTPGISPEDAECLLESALQAGIAGVLVSGGLPATSSSQSASEDTPNHHLCHGYLTGGPTKEKSIALVQWIRNRYPDMPIIGSGGIIEPADALDFYRAGADFVQLHSGLVFSGPGLPKRINEAVWQNTCPEQIKTEASSTFSLRNSWRWLAGVLLGIGMIAGGALALLVAVTSVVLPYDEAFLGMRADELALANPQILPFMSHDRISLAGTMISIGVLYSLLSGFGLRRHLHWARQTLLASGTIGFLSFFLFIGYGYFDILHAVLALLLLPFFLLSLTQSADKQLTRLPPQVFNDADWRRSLWGQLLFVIIGCGLTGAGLVISLIGITHVFVPQDLAFLCATPELLAAYNDRLIPLIAHDRAGFGGALFSVGIAVLLISLWGFRQGEAWVWWALFLGGLPGFTSGIGIHFAVGYTDFLHLLPAYVGALLFLLALALTYPYFCLPKLRRDTDVR